MIQDQREKRSFIPKDFEISDWESLKPYYDFLMEQEPESLEALEAFLKQISELGAVVQEDRAWRYIRMTCDTKNQELVDSFQFFVQEIIPSLAVAEDKLNRKLAEHPLFDQLPDEKFLTYKRALKNHIALYREENVELGAKSQSISQRYGGLIGAMSIEHEGEELTLQQANKILESRDRELREQVWHKVEARRAKDRTELSEIYDQLIDIRSQIAKNADFDSFTNYKFAELGRFDYTQKETEAFHHAVETVVKPIYGKLIEERKRRLGLEELRPWDMQVDIFGEEPLRPFEGAEELVEKSLQALSGLKPALADMIQLMHERGFLDLESRVGKAPGGYNYPLAESGIPFIFMNAAGTQSDVITMLHESGHAVHAFVTNDIPLVALKSTPSEVAELAAMSMELLALDGYKEFYADSESLTRAQKGQLSRCITIFPWVATVDAFQQWVYNHPEHTPEARNQQWKSLYKRFHGDYVNWEGLEANLENLWLKQMHIFEVPFYYIEYAIAQLGALAIWRNFKLNPEKGLEDYLSALKLGYTRSIPEIYETAGIRFDFSEPSMREQVEFCMDAYEAL